MVEINHNNNNGYATPKKSTPGSKRKAAAAAYKHDDTSQLSARKKKEMRIRLSLTRPSYVLGLCTKPLRSEHRRRLHYLLRKLVNQHDWVGASGVMSVYLKGTVNDTSPLKNRFKFWVLLELLKHVEDLSRNSTRIRNLYDIWAKKIGSMKTWPLESRYAVQLEFMLFYLMQGNVEDNTMIFATCKQDQTLPEQQSQMVAPCISPLLSLRAPLKFWGDAVLTASYLINSMPSSVNWITIAGSFAGQHESPFTNICLSNITLSVNLEQEKVDIDPVSKMMMGLTFYELWYSSSIPDEFKWRDLDQIEGQEVDSHTEGTSFSNKAGPSEWHNSVQSHMADSQYRCESDSSVMNNRQISKEIGLNKREKSHHIIQPENFYMISEESQEINDPSNIRVLTQDDLYALGRLDLWLPLRFSDVNGLSKIKFNNYYNSALKYLHLALDSTSVASESSVASAALLPLIQLLLIGGQVDEALTLLENQCNSSHSVLPIRLRVALLEHFDRNNSLLISSCYEDILKKDPTCRDSLAKLIRMHQIGEYSLESLLEIIALHVDATDAEYNTWKVFSLCFSKLSLHEEDQMSTCYENGRVQHSSIRKTPNIFTEGISAKSWNLRCRWWLTRYFSNSKFESDIKTGDLQLLTYKAACALYMYGQEFNYVVKAYSHLKKENDKDLLLFLNGHKRNSYVIYDKNSKKASCIRL